MNNSDNHYSAVVIHDSFMRAMALPEVYAKESVEIVLKTLKEESKKHKDNMEPREYKLIQHYIKYLQEVINNED